ncbi:hypothetical protein [Hydrogenimonas sp.]
MTLIDFAPLFFLAVSIFCFVLEYNKKYSLLRRKEAERYFNGSIVNDDDGGFYKERNYTKGLSLSKDKDGKSFSFKKQAKMCDTAILY